MSDQAKKQSKESIVRTYRELVKASGGALVGREVFLRETGISRYHFGGGYWRNWSAFQAELGYTPNTPTPRIEDETILASFAQLALELGHIPTEADTLLKRKRDSSFPGKGSFRRWGSREAMLAMVAEYCRELPRFSPVVELLDRGGSVAIDARLKSQKVAGYVYLLRSGKHFKLGRTNATGRRLRELAIQLPQKPDTVHVIETDDPEGIEQYWHRRFADKRHGGEWFTLTADDVRAFKRRRFQ